jgi:ATP-dependent Clp protease protease subunit
MTNKFEVIGGRDYRAFIEGKLLEERTILLYGGINQEIAQEVTEKLLFLSTISKKDDIKMYINSQGGHVESGDTIFDMIRFCGAPVKVIGTGWVASAGALIYCAPPVENRLSLPNTRYMIHQPLGGVSGSATDLAIEAGEIVKMRRRLNETIAKACGQPVERVEKDSDRNYWMGNDEAIKYGLVGRVVNTRDKV